ncbi:MAG: Zn-ribbon domain-containing OB-fold protein [Streptosporangiaceae bacterium]
MSGTRQVPVAQGLFTWPSDELRLIGAQCAGCGLVAFLAGPPCPRCGGTEFTEKLLSDQGTLWTFTTQDFRPPSAR